MCDEKERPFSELVDTLANSTMPIVTSYIFCMPNPLNPLQEFSSIIHYCIYAMARELRVVAVNHRSAIRQIFRQKVAEPHPPEIAFPPPRPIRMPVETRDSDDAVGVVGKKSYLLMGRSDPTQQ